MRSEIREYWPKSILAEPQVFATSNSKSAVEEELIDNKKEIVVENCNGTMANTAPLVSVNGSTPTGVEWFFVKVI